MFGSRKSKHKSLYETRLPAVGTVVGVRDTNATVDETALRVDIHFRIEPLDGSEPYDGHMPATLAREALPETGERYPILYDGGNRGTFVYVTSDGSMNARQRIVWIWGDAFGPEGDLIGPATQGEGGGTSIRDPLDRIAKLDALRHSGALTEAEFEEQKRRILDEMSAGGPSAQ